MSSSNPPSAPTSTTMWLSVLLPLCLAWRIGWANRMPIMDCDEVYNYWEPLHFLLEGSGLQTWEYAHEYALRTYAYLLPMVGLSRLYGMILPLIPSSGLVPLLMDVTSTTTIAHVDPKFVLFLLLRSTLAAIMAISEVRFCRALETSGTCSSTVAKMTLFVLQSSAGLAHASGALLPSTAWTVAWLLAATACLHSNQKQFVVIAVTATLAIGWPFGVLTLVPIGAYVLMVQTLPSNDQFASSAHFKAIVQLLIFTAIITIAVQAIVMIVDYQQYGIWTSPNVNIFRYNAQGGGDELYGVEPTSYYIKNLLLNFNGVAVLGIASAGMLILAKMLGSRGQFAVLLALLLPLYLWLAIVVPRPHKEERFLFPIYPIFCFGAVLTADILFDGFFAIVHRMTQARATSPHRTVLHVLLFLPMAVLSMSRIFALNKYYTAPLAIYGALHSENRSAASLEKTALVCTCGEWYRFPSSFTLPPNHELAFLPSSFGGQLPQSFSKHGSSKESQAVLQPFNDQNQHEPQRYSTLNDCDYVVDLKDSTDCQVPASSELIATADFLDADKTTSTLHRTLYVPFLHEKGIEQGTIHYQSYVLYKL